MSHAAHISSQTDAPAAFDLLLGLAAPIELAARFADRSPDDTGIEALAMRVVETGREQDPAVTERIRDLVSITRSGLEVVAKLRRAGAPPAMIKAAGNTLVDELADSIAVIAKRIS